MPDLVHNTLTITKGDPKVVFDLVRSEQSVIDFNRLIQMPSEIQSSGMRKSTGRRRRSRSRPPASEIWCMRNWGSKCNANAARYSPTDPEHALLFDTLSSPPEPIFVALAKRFPGHDIVIDSEEEEYFLHLTYTIKEGQLAVALSNVVDHGAAELGILAGDSVLTALAA